VETETSRSDEASPPTKLLPGPLPVWPILRDAVTIPLSRWRHFGRLMVIPIVLWLGLQIVGEETLFQEKSNAQLADVGGMLLLWLLQAVIFTLFAVSCHRSILLGEDSVSRFGFAGWGARETRFLIRLFIAYLVAFVIFALSIAFLGFFTSFISTIFVKDTEIFFPNPAYFLPFYILLIIPFAYVLGPISPILPAAAVDLKATIKSVWDKSLGNEWRMALIVGAPILFWWYITLLVLLLIGEEIHPVLSAGIGAAVYFVTATVEIVALSLAFKELFNWNPPAEGSTT